MKLIPHNFREAEYRRTEYLVTADQGTTIEDLLTPEYWSHVAGRLRVHDRVDVHAADGSWFVEMLVRSANRSGANLVVLHRHSFVAGAGVSTAEGNIDVRFRGATAKWSAIRKSDKKILIEGCDTEEEVRNWLKKPSQAQAAA